MKKVFKYIGIISIIIFFTSCDKDFLNQVPDDRLTLDLVFQRKLESERYLATGYSYIRDEQNQKITSPWLGTSDEVDVSWDRPGDGYNTHQINIGNWSPLSNYYQAYNHYYRGIRHITAFIQRIENNAEILQAPGGDQLAKRYKAEARALRAWFYFSLVKQYGPVVIIPGDVPIGTDQSLEELQKPQNTFDECVDFIVSELDKAAEDLPEWYDQGNMLGDLDYGRVTKSFCLATKSRILLYAASPLYNGNTDLSTFVSSEGRQLINQTYDAEKWKKALDAAYDVIDLNRFELYKEMVGGVLDPLLSYQNMLIKPWNEEVIFARLNSDLGARGYERDATPRFAGGWSGLGVTQQQVDTYYMANGQSPIVGYNGDGSPIINAVSGYSEVGTTTTASPKGYWKAGTYNMWVNREPRFYASVVFHKSDWINKSEGVKEIELTYTGNTGKYNSFDYSKTGYLVKKNVSPTTYPTRSTYPKRPWVLFRLGEIYLNYVEALNEYSPSHPDILTYLNLIRVRAGIPTVTTNPGYLPMQEIIRKERRIELAFESFRYFDTRRWKIAPSTDAGPFSGMNIDKNAPDFYQRTVFETRIFRRNYYFFPIPQFEMDRNRALVQNPYW